MQKIVDGICDTSTEIEKINEISKQTIVEMNRFVTQLNELQSKINEETELARQQIEKGNEINERQAGYIDKLVECQTSIGDLATHVQAEADAVQKSVDLISDHCKTQIDGITDAAKQSMETLSDSTKVLVESSHQQMQSLAATAESEMQMLSETASSLSEDNHNQLLALTKASSEQMGQLSAAANAVMQNSQQQITVAITATQTQSDSLVQATNDFVEFVQQEHQTLVQAVNKEISGLSNFCRANHFSNAVRNCRNIILIAFYVAEMYQHIQRLFFFYHTVKISVCPMRITYDQYLHILLSQLFFCLLLLSVSFEFYLCSRILRIFFNPSPLWLSSFFFSGESSALVHPYSGRKKIGS